MNVLDDVFCKDCQGSLVHPAVIANPYYDGDTLLCTACSVLCDTDGSPLKVDTGDHTPQRIYQMAGAIMTENELLSTVIDDDTEDDDSLFESLVV